MFQNARKLYKKYPGVFYQQYGYQYLKDIVNFGNGIDRLYVKELGL